MNKKQMNKIKYSVVSCIVALSLIVCINAPVVFKASVSEYFGGYSSGSNYSLTFSPISSNVVNGSVHYFDDYFANGTVYYDYTIFDAFHLIGSAKCLNTYSAIRTYSSGVNFYVNTHSYVNSFQLAYGTYEEFINGNYHTVCATGSIFTFEGTRFDEINVIDYGIGEEIFIGLVFNCYSFSTPDNANTRLPNIDFNFSGSFEFYGYDTIGAVDLIYQSLDGIYGVNEEISADLKNILSKYDSIEDSLAELSEFVQDNYDRLSSIDARIIQLTNQISALSDKLNSLNNGIGDVNDELDKHTNWLEKIWNSIQDFLKMNQEQEEQQENINNSVNGSLGNLGNLSNDLNFSKPDINDINVNVNQYIPQEYIDDYSTLLKVFTGHTVIKDMLLIAFTVCIISYTLFGKKR